MTDSKAAEVLRFWFEEHPKDWFAKNPAFDAEIRARFLALYEDAAAGLLSHWADAPRTCLALVILLDQFPRNLFRGDARAFDTDAMARAAARVILERGWGKAMSRSEQLFAALPFEHSESLDDQHLSCELMTDFEPELLRYAIRHREIIERFGRFPHRNAILGRESTPAETEFLKQPGSSLIGGTLSGGVLGGFLAAALAASGAPAGAVDKLLGPERSLLPPALVQSLSGALQGGMERIFLAVAVIALAGFAASLLFPAVPIAPREAKEDD